MPFVIAPVGNLAATDPTSGEIAVIAVAVEANSDDGGDLSQATEYLCVRRDGCSFWQSSRHVTFTHPEQPKEREPKP